MPHVPWSIKVKRRLLFWTSCFHCLFLCPPGSWTCVFTPLFGPSLLYLHVGFKSSGGKRGPEVLSLPNVSRSFFPERERSGVRGGSRWDLTPLLVVLSSFGRRRTSEHPSAVLWSSGRRLPQRTLVLVPSAVQCESLCRKAVCVFHNGL